MATVQFARILDARLGTLLPHNTGPAPAARATPALVPQPTPTPNAPVPRTTSADLSRTIQIHGTAVVIRYADIPDPPAVPLGNDICALAAQWGDNPTEWETVKFNAYLRIGTAAVPIPMQSWRAVYSGWPRLNDRRWKGAKGPWMERKVQPILCTWTSCSRLVVSCRSVPTRWIGGELLDRIHG